MNKKKIKRNKSKKSQNSIKRLTKVFLFIFLFSFLAVSLSYFIMQQENNNKAKSSIKKPIIENKKKSEELKEFEEKELDEYFDKKRQEEVSNPKYEEITEEFKKDIIEDKKPQIEKKPSEEEKEKLTEKKSQTYNEKTIVTTKDTYVYNKKDKPKLAIVIDDVTTAKQKNKILNVGYKVTMSFLPPTKGHKNSAKIAHDLPFYMIHFPLQASSKFKGSEDFTLNIADSYDKIEKRVAQLRQWYPKAIYTNNHTGSVFTQDEKAVDNLFKALTKYNFIFVDSRTTSKSVVKKYSNKYKMPYIVRNTFLDNERNFNYIQNQLIKAAEIAKKEGYAIAIGHPYSVTIEVLENSKHLLKDLDLIYLNQLPYLK